MDRQNIEHFGKQEQLIKKLSKELNITKYFIRKSLTQIKSDGYLRSELTMQVHHPLFKDRVDTIFHINKTRDYCKSRLEGSVSNEVKKNKVGFNKNREYPKVQDQVEFKVIEPGMDYNTEINSIFHDYQLGRGQLKTICNRYGIDYYDFINTINNDPSLKDKFLEIQKNVRIYDTVAMDNNLYYRLNELLERKTKRSVTTRYRYKPNPHGGDDIAEIVEQLVREEDYYPDKSVLELAKKIIDEQKEINKIAEKKHSMRAEEIDTMNIDELNEYKRELQQELSKLKQSNDK